MEGRRVSRQSKKYNPLFILFLCLVAAAIILFIVSVVLGIRLKSANKKLKAAEAEVAELTATVSQLQEDLIASQNHASSQPSDSEGETQPGSGTSGSGSTPASSSSSSWLDLTGHQEVKVEPSNLLSGYTDYYTTASVNLRSGPSTNYDRIQTLDYGTKVQAAAKDGNWTFVKAGSRFGWINSDYLSTTAPAAQTSASSTSSSSGSSVRHESTSGSLKR